MPTLLLPLLLIAPLQRVPRPRPAAPAPPPPTSIALTVRTAAGEARTSVLPRQAPPAARPLAVLKAGEKPQIRWQVRDTDAKLPVHSIVVHFLVLREDAAGAPIPEGLQKGTLMDSVLGTDLPAHGSTTGEYNTAIYNTGIYLVEVELLDPQGTRLQYCAVDLKVE